jgi:hypothetical protein
MTSLSLGKHAVNDATGDLLRDYVIELVECDGAKVDREIFWDKRRMFSLPCIMHSTSAIRASSASKGLPAGIKRSDTVSGR